MNPVAEKLRRLHNYMEDIGFAYAPSVILEAAKEIERLEGELSDKEASLHWVITESAMLQKQIREIQNELTNYS